MNPTMRILISLLIAAAALPGQDLIPGHKVIGRVPDAKKIAGKPVCGGAVTANCVPATDAAGNFAIGAAVPSTDVTTVTPTLGVSAGSGLTTSAVLDPNRGLTGGRYGAFGADGLPRYGLVSEHDFVTRNLFPWSEVLTSGTWGKTNVTVSGDLITATADGGTFTRGHVVAIGDTQTMTWELKQGAGDTVKLSFHSGQLTVLLNFTTGQLSVVGSPSGNVSYSVTALSGGWYRVSTTRTVEVASGTVYSGIQMVTSGNTVHVRYPQLNFGTSTAYYYSTDNATFLDVSGSSRVALTKTGTTSTPVGASFNGTTDLVAGLRAHDAAWTVINCSRTRCDGVDSAAGSWINGGAQAGAVEYDLGNAGGYSGTVTYRLQYDRVLTAPEHMRAYSYIRSIVRSRWGGQWSPKALVTFVFDDTYATDLTAAKPLFDSKGIVGCSAVITGLVGTSSHLTVANLVTLQAAGWEMLAHTKTHPALETISIESATEELVGSAEIMRGWGLQVNNAAYPGGTSNAAVRAMTAQYFRSGRGVAQNVNYAPLITSTRGNTPSMFDIAAKVIDAPITAEQANAFVDKAIANNAWLILYAHQTDAAMVTKLTTIIDYIQAAGVPIVTINQALDLFTNPL
jgi:peptidoglycan/xylan/chitin deacetylase (PgdA/CDA1 family)